MADLVVIVPSRGRPKAAAELIQAFRETCAADTSWLFAVDENDPTANEYADLSTVVTGTVTDAEGREWVTREAAGGGCFRSASTTMVEALNNAARWVATKHPFAIAFLGDDHRPRTVGWDAAYLAALRELGTGIVYGDDLFQGEKLPTQVAMTSDIVAALGFMAPPTLRHLAVDNFWLDLGRAAGCIRYLPDVVVEHVHPAAGKAEWDEGHQRVNAPEMYDHDLRSYGQFRSDGLPGAVSAVRALRGDEPATTRGGWSGDEVHEWRLFPEGTVPEYTRPEWYAGREHAPHLEQEAHRGRLLRSVALVKYAVRTFGCESVVDLGAGDGGLLSLLDAGLPAWGYDLQPTNLEAAKARGVDVRYGDVVDGDVEWARLAVATEVIEHLVDPHAFVRRIAEHADVLVCSSPWTERPGNAYEYHAWCWDLDGYRALVEQAGFKVERQDVVGPFQVLLAVKP